jgi:hypothetical protein
MSSQGRAMSEELPLSKYEKKGFVVFNHFGFAPLTFLATFI